MLWGCDHNVKNCFIVPVHVIAMFQKFADLLFSL